MKPRRVLVVDDEAQLRRLVALAFELEGFDVETANDGAEAIEGVHRFAPDAMVLDIMMPRVDGLTALGEVRRFVSADELPVVVMSAKAQTADIEAGLAAGANDYVTKPFDTDDLVMRTMRLLGDPGLRAAGF
jgi:two-component system OmpR family response regulator